MKRDERHFFEKDSYCILDPETVTINKEADIINWHQDVLNSRAMPLILVATTVKAEEDLEHILETAEKSNLPLVKIIHALQGSAVGDKIDANNRAVDVIIAELIENRREIEFAKKKHESLPYYNNELFAKKWRFRFSIAKESLMLFRRNCFDLTDKVLRQGVDINTIQRGAPWNTEKKKALIVSILKGFPIGTFYLNKTFLDLPRLKYADILLDGRERICAVNEFLFGEFPVPTEFGELYYQQACEFFNEGLSRYTLTICETSLRTIDGIIDLRKTVNQ